MDETEMIGAEAPSVEATAPTPEPMLAEMQAELATARLALEAQRVELERLRLATVQAESRTAVEAALRAGKLRGVEFGAAVAMRAENPALWDRIMAVTAGNPAYAVGLQLSGQAPMPPTHDKQSFEARVDARVKDECQGLTGRELAERRATIYREERAR